MSIHFWHKVADERLGDPFTRCNQEPLVVTDTDGRPQEDHTLDVYI